MFTRLFKLIARLCTFGVVGKTDRMKTKKAERDLARTEAKIAEQTLRAMKKQG